MSLFKGGKKGDKEKGRNGAQVEKGQGEEEVRKEKRNKQRRKKNMHQYDWLCGNDLCWSVE